MARFDLVREWIVLLIGTATLACHILCERALLLFFVKYSTCSEYSLRWLWALVGLLLQRVMAYLRAI